MSGNRIRALLGSDIARLAVVAALGAGLVLSFQAITQGKGGAGSRPAVQSAAGAAPAGPGAAKGAPPAAGARRPAAKQAAGAAPAAAAVGGSAAAAPAPVTTATLGRLPVSGPGLAVVVDAPAGPLAEQNRLIIQGATVALDKLNAAGGVGHHPVRIVPEQLDGLSAAAVQSRLHAAGSRAVLVLPCDTNAQFTLAAGAARYGTLMLAPCDADPSLARRIATYWPVGMAGNDEAAGLAGYMRTIGYGSVFVISTPGFTYADAQTRYFREAVQAKGIAVLGDATISLGLGAGETKRLAARIAALNPAAVFTALPPPYVNRLAAALGRAGAHQTLMGTSAMDTPLTLKSGTSALVDATFPSYGFLRQLPAVSTFVAAYRKRYGPPVGGFPGLGFETIRVLEDAIARARAIDPAAIGRTLAGGLTHTGVTLTDRSYQGGANHNPISTVSVEKVSSGSFLPLLTAMPTGSPQA